MKTVHVAAGIVRAQDGSDKVLAARRGYGEMKGLWEFPGGKVERHESAEEACRRELKEELNIRVRNLQAFYTVQYDYPDKHLSMECFFCDIEDGEPACDDNQLELRWVSRRALATLEWMPADIDLVNTLAAGAAESDDALARDNALVKRRRDMRHSMQGNKRANTKPELLVRQRLREAGLTGYRLQWKKAPGRPDIAFPGRKIAIFVNGCFWHRCPHCNPSTPKRNVEYWQAKFHRNVERDKQAVAELEEMGWTAITIWECQLKRDKIDATMEEVIETVRAAAPSTASRTPANNGGAASGGA